jgi:type II secretory pathway pseudopilin PulG
MMGTMNYFKRRSPTKLTEQTLKGASGAGFTIVETLIVLAVAGLILLIVFEVIPSVERASINNQRKQDVSLILGAVSQYELKDSGNFPLLCGTVLKHCSASVGSTNDYFLRYVETNLTYYTAVTAVQLTPQISGAGSVGANANPDTVQVYDFEICDTNGSGGASSTAADYSDVVALYALQTGNGVPQSECQNI